MKDDAIVPKGVKLYDFEDHDTHRKLIFEDAKTALASQYPYSHNGVRMELHDLDYADPETVSLKEQKKAILENRYLARRLRGTLRLFDENTGDMLDEKSMTLMRVPYLTQRGTYVHGGNDYASIAQSRLLPGMYTRRQKSGELETQVNVRSGTGTAFRVGLEPSTSQYRMRVQSANLHLYSLLRDLGESDEKLSKTWGPEVLEANRAKYDSRVLDKAYERFVSKWNRVENPSREEKARAVKEALEHSQVHARVARRNVPNMFDRTKAAEWALAPDPPPAVKLAHYMEKRAMLNETEVQALAAFLNREHQAGLDLDATTQALEGQIMEFVQNDQQVNPALLQAGIEAQRDYQEEQEAIAGPEPPELPKYASLPSLPAQFEKLARFGAGVLFRQPNGKYLLQENQSKDVGPDDQEANGKLRPAGGGKHPSDRNLKATILREMEEEFGIPKEIAGPKVALLGYITKGEFQDCAIFEYYDHGLKPGWYTASNSKDEKIKLVEADLDDPRYIGPKLTSLRKFQKHYRPTPKSRYPAWIGVDLDGTLAHSEPGVWDPSQIGEPIPAMMERVKGWLAEGKTVKLFTARAAEPKWIPRIQSWLKMHGLPELEITNVKDPGMKELWDDRARTVERNTGRDLTKSAAMSAEALEDQGSCCGNGCVNCPYDPRHEAGTTELAARPVKVGRFVTSWELEGYGISLDEGRRRSAEVDNSVAGETNGEH